MKWLRSPTKLLRHAPNETSKKCCASAPSDYNYYESMANATTFTSFYQKDSASGCRKGTLEMMQLALVTGGAVRIGQKIASHLARCGFAVAIQYNRSKKDAEDTVEAIMHEGGKAAAFKAALNVSAEVGSLIPAVNQAMGTVTCLINNASRFRDDRLPFLSEAEWDSLFAVNLKAPIFLSQAFAKQLPDDKSGNIINIVDQRVLRPNPLFFSYSLSKSALWTATRTLAQALAPKIRVNAIGPGPTLANIYQSADEFERERSSTLLGRGTTPEEIARAVEFILSAPAMTGQMIALDGGQHLLWQTPDIIVK